MYCSITPSIKTSIYNPISLYGYSLGSYGRYRVYSVNHIMLLATCCHWRIVSNMLSATRCTQHVSPCMVGFQYHPRTWSESILISWSMEAMGLLLSRPRVKGTMQKLHMLSHPRMMELGEGCRDTRSNKHKHLCIHTHTDTLDNCFT